MRAASSTLSPSTSFLERNSDGIRRRGLSARFISRVSEIEFRDDQFAHEPEESAGFFRNNERSHGQWRNAPNPARERLHGRRRPVLGFAEWVYTSRSSGTTVTSNPTSLKGRVYSLREGMYVSTERWVTGFSRRPAGETGESIDSYQIMIVWPFGLKRS
jgi:hypothetical protein